MTVALPLVSPTDREPACLGLVRFGEVLPRALKSIAGRQGGEPSHTAKQTPAGWSASITKEGVDGQGLSRTSSRVS